MATVLLAGEDVAVSAILTAEIEAEGHEVLSALDGQLAMDMALTKQPDLVVLDVSLRVFNGYEVCAMLREDPDIPRALPIVLVSSRPIDSRTMAQVGATRFLSKTHSHGELRELLTNLLGRNAA